MDMTAVTSKPRQPSIRIDSSRVSGRLKAFPLGLRARAEAAIMRLCLRVDSMLVRTSPDVSWANVEWEDGFMIEYEAFHGHYIRIMDVEVERTPPQRELQGAFFLLRAGDSRPIASRGRDDGPSSRLLNSEISLSLAETIAACFAVAVRYVRVCGYRFGFGTGRPAVVASAYDAVLRNRVGAAGFPFEPAPIGRFAGPHRHDALLTRADVLCLSDNRPNVAAWLARRFAGMYRSAFGGRLREPDGMTRQVGPAGSGSLDDLLCLQADYRIDLPDSLRLPPFSASATAVGIDGRIGGQSLTAH
jgi:hypothetical protein